MFWNIEGNKSPLKLNSDLEEYGILSLVETMSTEELRLQNITKINIPAVKMPKGRPKGGITIALHQRVNDSMIKIASTEHLLAIKMEHSKANLIIAYFPPKYEIEEMTNEITDIIPKANLENDTILIGDFNCRLDKTDERTRQEY